MNSLYAKILNQHPMLHDLYYFSLCVCPRNIASVSSKNHEDSVGYRMWNEMEYDEIG